MASECALISLVIIGVVLLNAVTNYDDLRREKKDCESSCTASRLSLEDRWRAFVAETFITAAVCTTFEESNDRDGMIWAAKLSADVRARFEHMPEAVGVAAKYKQVAKTVLETTTNTNCSSEPSKLAMRETMAQMQKAYTRIIKPLPPSLTWDDIKLCMPVYFETDFGQLLDPGQLTQQPNGWVGIIAGIMRPQGWVEIWDGRSNGRYSGVSERRHGSMNIFRMPTHFIATHMGGPAKPSDVSHLPSPPPELRRVCPNLSHNGYSFLS